MQNTKSTHPWLRILRDVILLELLILLSVGLVHLLAGWENIHQYGVGLVWAGVIGVLFLLVSAGWRDGRRQDLVALSQLMREHEVFYLLNRENSGRARFLLVGLIALVITFVIGGILISVV